MSFGLPVDGATEYWGARAIRHRSISVPARVKHRGKWIDDFRTVPAWLDFLPDRQSVHPEGGIPHLRRFMKMGKVYTWLKKQADMEEDEGVREKEFTLKDGSRVVARCTPNQSHGYMYIGVGWFPRACEPMLDPETFQQHVVSHVAQGVEV